MSVSAPAITERTAQAAPGAGFLYGWLLVALFVEYGRPASFLPVLDLPYFYSVFPLTLFVVSMFASGLRPMKEVFSDRIAGWVMAFFGLVLLSLVSSPVFEFSSKSAVAVSGYVILFLLIARIVTTESRIRGVVFTLALAHLFLVVNNPDALFNPQQRHGMSGASFLGDGNDFSMSLCLLLPCIAYAALSFKNPLARLLCWAFIVVLVLAVIATQSRGATLGLLAIMGYIWWRSPRKLAATAIIAIIAIGAVLYAPAEYFARMDTLTTGATDGSAQGRIGAWKGAIGMGIKNPILGIGTGHFGSRWGMTAHSTYMLAFAELGIPGFICVVMLVFGNIRANIRLRRQFVAAMTSPERVRQLQVRVRDLDLLTAAAIGFAVAGAFLSACYYPHLFVLSGLLISARQLLSRYLATAGSQTVPAPRRR